MDSAWCRHTNYEGRKWFKFNIIFSYDIVNCISEKKRTARSSCGKVC